ncbi:hypothetical protein [Thalassotalea agariperforans]
MKRDTKVALLEIRFELEKLLGKKEDWSVDKCLELISQDAFVSTLLDDYDLEIGQMTIKFLKKEHWVSGLLESINECLQYETYPLKNNTSGFAVVIHIINQRLGLNVFHP